MAEQLSQTSPDLLRNMIQTFAEALMSADADAVCGAGYGQRSTERTNTRNGYRRRVGTPGPGRSTWPSRSCGRAATSRSGCWSGAGGPSPP
jgi:transposase-like protein